MTDKPNSILFHSAKEWRQWLSENHKISKEVWLIYYKKHSEKISVSYNEAVEEALCFGWIDGLVRKIDEEKYMQRYTPRRDKSIWSETNKERIEKLILERKMTEAGLKKVEAAKSSGEWYKAKERTDVPELSPELNKILKSKPVANKNFLAFPPSYRKMAIWWIMSAKKDETRKRRINELLSLASENKRLGMK